VQPGERGGLEGGGGQRPARVKRLEAEHARQRERRVVARDRDADARVAGREPALGGHDVGPAPQQFRRASGGGDRRHLEVGRSGDELAFGRPRRHAGEHVQPEQLRRQLAPQRRHAGLRLQQQAVGLRHFARGAQALVAAQPDEVDQLRLVVDLALRDGDARLRAAHAQVGVGRLAGQRDARARVLRLDDRQLRVGGLLAAPQSAGEVGLPARAGVQLRERLRALIARRMAREFAERAAQRLAFARQAGVDGDGGQAGGARAGRDRARLRDALARGREVQVACQRAFDEACEHGVVEALPPRFERGGRRLARASGQRAAAVVREGRREVGRAVVGADRAAGQRGGRGQGRQTGQGGSSAHRRTVLWAGPPVASTAPGRWRQRSRPGW